MVVLFGRYVLFGRCSIYIGSLVVEQKLKHFRMYVFDQQGYGIGSLIYLLTNCDKIVYFEPCFVPCLFQSLEVIVLPVVLIALLYQLAEKEMEQRQCCLIVHLLLIIIKQYHLIFMNPGIMLMFIIINNKQYNIDKMSIQEKLYKFMNEMDFISQDKASSLVRAVILIVALVSYLVGFYFQKFSYCVYSVLVAMAILILIVMPGGMPWWRQPPRVFAKSKSKVQ